MDMVDRAPDGWQLFEPHGYPAAIHFYYGATAETVHLLPIEAEFGMVSSPNYYVHPESPLRPWSCVVFKVNLFQFRPGRPLERSYKQIRRRQLTRFEADHFEALWLDLLMMGRKAG